MTRGRSFSDSDTHFYLPHFPYTDQSCGPEDSGHRRNEATGEVVCECCYASAMSVDEIHHDPECEQFDVKDEETWAHQTLEEVLAAEYSGEELQQVIEAHHDELDIEQLPCDCGIGGLEPGCELESGAHAHADD